MILGLKSFKIISFLFLIMTNNNSQIDIEIKISGFKNNTGNAFIRIKDANDKTLIQKVFPIKNKVVSIKENLPITGKYAIETFHDENNNQKLDTNIMGIPKEAWGVSNNIRPSFRGPSLEEMLLELSKGSVVNIVVK